MGTTPALLGRDASRISLATLAAPSRSSVEADALALSMMRSTGNRIPRRRMPEDTNASEARPLHARHS
jgi:hypothetical protein